jgi:hypothetical protein
MNYKHQKIFKSQEYILTDTTLEVIQKEKFGTDYTVNFELNTFRLPHATSFQRRTYHFLPVATIGVIIFLASFYTFIFHRHTVVETPDYLVMAIGVITLISSYFTGKKEKMVFYNNNDNVSIIGLTENKNDREQFNAFISAIDTNIETLKKTNT